MKKENTHKELESIAPYLASQKQKDSPFKVPDNYFDQFEKQLLENIKETSTTSNPITKVRQLSYWLSRAAAILILGVGAFYLLTPTKVSDSDLFADVTTEEINLYLAEHIYEFEEEQLFEEGLFPEDDFSEEEIDVYLEEHLDEIEAMDLDNLL